MPEARQHKSKNVVANGGIADDDRPGEKRDAVTANGSSGDGGKAIGAATIPEREDEEEEG